MAVQDLDASKTFYEQLGFAVIAGQASENWLILRNQGTVIGLFQGMFDRNLLTFNPGWDADMQTLPAFEDVREIQARLESSGIELQSKADPNSTGPASFSVVDPDGNPVLIDQHVPKPA